MIVVALVEGVLAYFLFRVYTSRSRLPDEINDSSVLIPYIEKRIKEQDVKLADVLVKLEIVETMMNRRSFQRSQLTQSLISNEDLGERIAKKEDALHDLRENRPSSEKMVLEALTKNDLTAVDVMNMLGCTREHAARLMKSLFVQGFVVRDDKKRPFVYSITEEGRKSLDHA